MIRVNHRFLIDLPFEQSLERQPHRGGLLNLLAEMVELVSSNGLLSSNNVGSVCYMCRRMYAAMAQCHHQRPAPVAHGGA